MNNLDQKIVERIQKLLNLARDGGATEGEANSAMAMAERIMMENNLSMAQVEMSGGAASEARLKEQSKGKANFRWQRWLMSAIAEANFVHCAAIVDRVKNRHGYREMTRGYQLIGRISNVTATRHMYEYLLQTCGRMREEFEAQPGKYKDDGALFVEGLANRLAQRVVERHRNLLAKQKQEADAKAREQAARASHPAAAATGNALVVVMFDYQAQEQDLNNDTLNGWKPGTTLAKRTELERKSAEKDQRIKDLIAEHSISWDIAWNMVHLSHSLEEAKAYQVRWEAEQKAAGESTSRSRYRGGRSREDRLHDRLFTGAAGEGRRAAENVSLNEQVGTSSQRRIK